MLLDKERASDGDAPPGTLAPGNTRRWSSDSETGEGLAHHQAHRYCEGLSESIIYAKY
jgi:hypothetical protein